MVVDCILRKQRFNLLIKFSRPFSNDSFNSEGRVSICSGQILLLIAGLTILLHDDKEIIFTHLSRHINMNFGSQCKIIVKQGRQLSFFVFNHKFNYFQAKDVTKF